MCGTQAGRQTQIKSSRYATETTVFRVTDKNATQPDSPWVFTSHKGILLCHPAKDTWGRCTFSSSLSRDGVLASPALWGDADGLPGPLPWSGRAGLSSGPGAPCSRSPWSLD